MKLASNFTLSELTRTSHRRYLAENRKPPEEVVEALKDTAQMLQTIRDHYKSPVVVHSGYRCPALNSAVGGSTSSQHVAGAACDFHVVGVPLKEAWEWIWKKSDLKFGQLILEGWAAGEPSWIHLSLGVPYRSSHKCGQVLTWDKKNGYVRIYDNNDPMV